MLELKTYTFSEIAAYLNVSNSRGVRDKLTRYKVEYKEDGGNRDLSKSYVIIAIHDPFKLFCVFDLGIAPQTDFRKLRDFTFYLLTDGDFSWRPQEMMAEYLRCFSDGPTRQTIGKYLEFFERKNLISSNGEYVYYKVYKDGGIQKHEIITKADYSAAWAVYWDCRKEKGYDSGAAYSTMYQWLGGVPRKQHKILQNAFCLDELDRLEQYATDSIIAEYGEIPRVG